MFVNGCWVGIHRRPQTLVKDLKSLRRRVNLPVEVSIVWDMRAKELRLGSDAGRTCRPLFIVDDNKIRLTREHIHKLRLPEEEDRWSFSTLVENGLIEYAPPSSTQHSTPRSIPLLLSIVEHYRASCSTDGSDVPL